MKRLYCSIIAGFVTHVLACSVHAGVLPAPGSSVDSIDGTFVSGGGTITGSLSAGETNWFIFEANAGDALTIETLDIVGAFDTGLALFREVSNGIVEIDDILEGGTVTPDLSLIAQDDDGGDGRLSFISVASLPQSGAYAISLGGFSTSEGEYSLRLAGNTANVPGTMTPVPLPASGLLILAGLGGLAVMRRKRKA